MVGATKYLQNTWMDYQKIGSLPSFTSFEMEGYGWCVFWWDKWSAETFCEQQNTISLGVLLSPRGGRRSEPLSRTPRVGNTPQAVVGAGVGVKYGGTRVVLYQAPQMVA